MGGYGKRQYATSLARKRNNFELKSDFNFDKMNYCNCAILPDLPELNYRNGWVINGEPVVRKHHFVYDHFKHSVIRRTTFDGGDKMVVMNESFILHTVNEDLPMNGVWHQNGVTFDVNKDFKPGFVRVTRHIANDLNEQLNNNVVPIINNPEFVTMGDSIAAFVKNAIVELFPGSTCIYKEFLKLHVDASTYFFRQQLKELKRGQKLVFVISAFNDYVIRFAHHTCEGVERSINYLSTRILKDPTNFAESRLERYEIKDLRRLVDVMAQDFINKELTNKVLVVLVIPYCFDLYGAFRSMIKGEGGTPLSETNIDVAPYADILAVIRRDMESQRRFLNVLSTYGKDLEKKYNFIHSMSLLKVVDDMKVVNRDDNVLNIHNQKNIIHGCLSNHLKGVTTQMGILPVKNLMYKGAYLWAGLIRRLEEFMSPRSIVSMDNTSDHEDWELDDSGDMDIPCTAPLTQRINENITITNLSDSQYYNKRMGLIPEYVPVGNRVDRIMRQEIIYLDADEPQPDWERLNRIKEQKGLRSCGEVINLEKEDKVLVHKDIPKSPNERVKYPRTDQPPFSPQISEPRQIVPIENITASAVSDVYTMEDQMEAINRLIKLLNSRAMMEK